MSEHQTGDQIETEQQALKEGLTFVEVWLRKLADATEEEKDWRKMAEEAVDVYEADDGKTSFNIFHSNVETLVPALYNSTPVPDVRRRYGDSDPVAKMTVDMLERAISYSVDQYDFDGDMRGVVRDAVVPGRGVLRIRYEPQFVDQSGVEVKGYEQVTCERVAWDKFRRGPGRRWADVPWIAFKHDLTREELLRLSPKVGAEIEVKSEKSDDRDDEQDDTNDKGIFRTAVVWEIWDKPSKSVIFIAEEHKERPLKVEQDPLQLDDFFPVPRPLQQIERVSSLTPVVPYEIYRPLIEELDVVTKRIRKLVAQLRVRGIVAADVAKDVESLRSNEDGQYVSANEAATFLSGGGKLENAVAHWPLDPTVKALQQLYVQRDAIKATIYEVTGLSDILRGASDANETATAQQIKSQWGSLRVQMMQKEVARLARDIFRLKAEIFAKHFSPQNLVAMANFNNLPPEQMQGVGPAIQLLKSDQRGFRVDIETDSTVRADMTRNQEQMNNFLAGTGQFVQGMMGAAQLMPALLPTMTEVYTAFARNFSLGKQAEDALDQLSQMAPQMAQAAEQAAGRDPEAEKMKQQMEFEQQKFELEKQKMGMDLQMKGADLQIKKAEMEMKQQSLQLDMEAKAADVHVKRQMADMDMQGRQMEMQFGQQAREQEFGHKSRMAEFEMGNKQKMAEAEFGHKSRMSDMELTNKAQSFQQSQAIEAQQQSKADPFAGALTELAAQLQKMLKETQDAARQNQEAIQALRETMAMVQQASAVKRTKIIRDKDGRAIGAETS